MRSTDARREQFGCSILILLGYSFFLLLACSIDSPLRIEYAHTDNAWFFMAGKAWMEGMTPYADFTDSKGPLLWLIYGIGYLISPDSFGGMFWLQVIAYWGTFVFLYLSAQIILKSSGKALAATFITSIFFFLPYIHFEIRAEDYNHLLNAVLLYLVMRTMTEGRAGKYTFLTSGIVLGASAMIKYNFTVMQSVPVLMMLIFTLKRDGLRRAAGGLGWCFAGFLIPVLPFVIYFICKGCMGVFMDEYFINTTLTIARSKVYDSPWTTRWGIAMILMFAAFAAYMPKRIYRSDWLRATVWLWFLASLAIILISIHEYYLNNLDIFVLVGVAALTSRIRKITYSGALMTGASACLIAVLLANFYKDGEFYDVENARSRLQQYGEATAIMENYKQKVDYKPTISYVNLQDDGFHIKAGLLPGTRYWAYQNGSTAEMHRHNYEDVLARRPDFVVVDATEREYRKKLEATGYDLTMIYYPRNPREGERGRALYSRVR